MSSSAAAAAAASSSSQHHQRAGGGSGAGSAAGVVGTSTATAAAAGGGLTTTSATTTTTTAGTTKTTTGGATTLLHSEDFQARMGQILDDQDHKRCSEGNHRALLAENLDQLRGLLKVIESDDWKYEKLSNGGNGSYCSSYSRGGINGSNGLSALFQSESDV